jgi:flagellar hook-associated protein 3 FlgL
MRVTDQATFNQTSADIARARDRLQTATQMSSSGARVTHPGDDPGAAGLLVTVNANQARFDAIQKTASQASDELASADGALDAVGNALTRAQELAMQMANSTNASARPGAAGEMQSILDQVVAALNTRVGNRYIFGGNVDNAPPFDAAGNYLGDQGVRQVEIAPGVTEASSVRADVAVKGVSGGVDVTSTLGALVAALAANDQAGIQAALDPLSQGISQVAQARTAVGNAMNAFDTAVTVGQAARDDQKKMASDLSDADVFQAATNLAAAQQALQMSLSATAQGFRLSLLDYLR